MNESIAIAVDRLRIAYVDVSKAASTSIKLAIRDALRLPQSAYTESVHATPWPHIFTSEKRPQGYFTFSCVRHPVDRVASAYANKSNTPERWAHLGHPELFKFGMSFEDFCQALTKIDLRTANRHICLQSSILKPYRCDTIFKMESTLKTNWWTVGIGELEHANTSDGVKTSGKIRRLLTSLYHEDMREYHYR